MKIFFLSAMALFALPLAVSAHLYLIPSPTHEQTFAFGSERHQQWLTRGPDRHLALSTEFTNDPYVDRTNPRQYDNFIFNFPSVRLGADSRTFYYQTSKGHLVPVAKRSRNFLGLEEVRLLDTSDLLIRKPHGYLTMALLVDLNRPLSTASL